MKKATFTFKAKAKFDDFVRDLKIGSNFMDFAKIKKENEITIQFATNEDINDFIESMDRDFKGTYQLNLGK